MSLVPTRGMVIDVAMVTYMVWIGKTLVDYVPMCVLLTRGIIFPLAPITLATLLIIPRLVALAAPWIKTYRMGPPWTKTVLKNTPPVDVTPAMGPDMGPNPFATTQDDDGDLRKRR